MELFSFFSDAKNVYIFSLLALSFGLIISSLENLVNRSMYTKTGLLSWSVAKHRARFFVKSRFFEFIFKKHVFEFILLFKLVAAILVFSLALIGEVSQILILLLFLGTLMLSLRTHIGLDGSHQMNLIVLGALMIGSLAGIYSAISSVCLWFIASELILSYFIAGINKIISPIWLKSHALNAIFSTNAYGHIGVYKLITFNKWFAHLLCWPVLVFEIFFAVAFVSEPVCIGLCFMGGLFHLFNAMFMGLNTFFFAFLAAYPVMFHCFAMLH